MKSIDKEVLAGYDAGIEKDRLHKDLGLIEFARTKEILRETLPPAPAVIYDIGGGYGEYAYFLTELGYEVYLYDLSKKNIELSQKMGRELGVSLKAAEVADARNIRRPDNSADAVLYSWANHEPQYEKLKLKEIGYVLSKDYWGRGLMPEAVRRVIAFCFEEQGLDALTVGHFSKNSQSRRVIEKCGFSFVREGTFYSKPMDRSFEDRKYILYKSPV